MNDILLYEMSKYLSIRHRYLNLFRITKRINNKMNNGYNISLVLFKILLEEDLTLNKALKYTLDKKYYMMIGCACSDRDEKYSCDVCGLTCCMKCFPVPHGMCIDCAGPCHLNDHVKCRFCNNYYCLDMYNTECDDCCHDLLDET